VTHWCLSGTGSDSTGTGTVDNPFRSITFALLATPAVPEVRVLPGIYESADGEVFPLNVPANVSIIGTMGPNQDEFDSAVIDAGASATALVLGQSATGQEGLIKDFVITNFKSVFTATKWRGICANAVVSGYGAPRTWPTKPTSAARQPWPSQPALAR